MKYKSKIMGVLFAIAGIAGVIVQIQKYPNFTSYNYFKIGIGLLLFGYGVFKLIVKEEK